LLPGWFHCPIWGCVSSFVIGYITNKKFQEKNRFRKDDGFHGGVQF